MTNRLHGVGSDLLVLENLSKIYGRVAAVNKLNLRISKGEFFSLLGPNGAGKTTTVRMISTLTPKTHGDIRVFGKSIDRNLTWIKGRIGVVPQRNNLESELTAWENLELHGLLYGLPRRQRRQRIEELLEFAGLQDRRNDIVRNYSGGMKRKMMIARSLMHSPDLLLLDEPTVGLDVGARRKIYDLLRLLKKQGLTVLLTTHYIEEAESLCDKVALLYRGRLIECDTPRTLIEKVGKFAVDYFQDDHTESHFFSDRVEASSFANRLPGQVVIRKVTLEDVFLQFTNSGERVSKMDWIH